MKAQNILIAIAVIGIGIILYKFLLGFVLPIALFVSLGYVFLDRLLLTCIILIFIPSKKRVTLK